ncbi:MAG: response regulator transcription factor [Bacteroidia bacterium]|nr:response regulator transcription factor [Bacteroidia bacterium]MCF8427888.1 response regulator transcription factor [Bacteroidia bacterium]MCF8447123.1 response regulator transcription factor [Bacteroidia bacterium]
MYKIVVADDHPITLMGTEAYLKELNHKVIGSFHNGVSCSNGILTLLPDLAVIDVSMPGMSGLEILALVKARKLKTKIILLTMHREMSVLYKAKEFNCDGYVLKDNAHNELTDCIEAVMKGEIYVSPLLTESFIIDKQPERTDLLDQLTQTERKVIELVSEQKTNAEIGTFLFITDKTVESHKRNICQKLNIPKGKNGLLIWAMKNLK